MDNLNNNYKKDSTNHLESILWIIYLAVTLVAAYIWAVQLNLSLSGLNAFTVFPLFGLLAFSLMWVHYITGPIRDTWFPDANTKKSFRVSSTAVLALILLHPTLLVTQLFRQGSGLPPGSYESYVAPGNTLFVLFGTVGLACILSFELKRFYSKKSWWKYVAILSDLGILLIAIHSVKLGQHLQSGWFRYLWYFYIFTIIICIIRIYLQKFTKKTKR